MSVNRDDLVQFSFLVFSSFWFFPLSVSIFSTAETNKPGDNCHGADYFNRNEFQHIFFFHSPTLSSNCHFLFFILLCLGFHKYAHTFSFAFIIICTVSTCVCFIFSLIWTQYVRSFLFEIKKRRKSYLFLVVSVIRFDEDKY